MELSALSSWRAAALPALAATLALGGASARAAIIYTGGVGDSVYGVAPYGAPAQALPTFIGDNVTGFSDILASPGHGFLTASPVIANNIFQFGPTALPQVSFQVGGGNGFGTFGAAKTAITGPRIAFAMRDGGHPGGGSLSYAISSWTSNYLVTAGGFTGNLGTFLSVGGFLPTTVSADAVSLVSNYYINGAYVGETAPLVLAAAGNGNFQALGGSGAAVILSGSGAWRGLAIDNIAAALPAGDTIKVVSTLTEFADPASIDSIAPDLSLLPGLSLPDFAFSDVSGAIPEPATWAMMLVGLGGLGAVLRRGRKTALAA
ncbi:MAG TPA: PEPxxWA-CTERM sorting domain-containing protein [Caulobacteraceae bacterium]|jgi:hypothetical protein|nr:PEPxxWA-CTERM sorting domain-containing protein [Caulobacteraceae bacterium]